MKKVLLILILPLLLLADEAAGPTIAVHNRPLLKLNGRTISLVDVMKKMNVFLYQHYPHAIGDKAMMYQFYTNNWRNTLDDIINNELMLLEAETREIKVSEGEVREEVEARYGPNVMANLAKLNLTLDEARELVHTDMIVQRVMWSHVHQKTLQDITPAVLKAAYAAYLVANPPVDEWTYQVLTIRGDNDELCKKIASQASALIHTCSLQEIADALRAQVAEEPDAPKISLSEEYELQHNKLSEQHRTVLETLKIGTCSEPIAQTSRALGKDVWRVYYLKDRQTIEPASFDSMHARLEHQLRGERFQHYSNIYYAKLREEYHLDKKHLDELIPENYTPFVMR